MGQASSLSIRDDRQDAGPTCNLFGSWKIATGLRPRNDNLSAPVTERVMVVVVFYLGLSNRKGVTREVDHINHLANFVGRIVRRRLWLYTCSQVGRL